MDIYHINICQSVHWQFCSLTVCNCQIQLAKKDLLLSNDIFILSSTELQTGAKDEPVKIKLSTGSHTTEDFNSKMKITILQGEGNFEIPKINDRKLVIT